ASSGTSAEHQAPSAASPLSGLSESLRDRFCQATDIEGFKLLASLLLDLAEAKQNVTNGRDRAAANQVRVLAERAQRAAEEAALLKDTLGERDEQIKDLTKKLETTESNRAALQTSNADLRSRLEKSLRERAELDANLTSQISAKAQAELESETQKIRADRESLRAQDRSALEAADTEKRRLTEELKR